MKHFETFSKRFSGWPIRIAELSRLKTKGLADHIKKDVSSKEVTTAYVDRSKKSKKLNTYITDNFENGTNFRQNYQNNLKTIYNEI